MTFAEAVKHYRKAKGWSQLRLQQEMIAETGKAPSTKTISHWENEKCDTTGPTERAVAKVLGFTDIPLT